MKKRPPATVAEAEVALAKAYMRLEKANARLRVMFEKNVAQDLLLSYSQYANMCTSSISIATVRLYELKEKEANDATA